MNTLAAVLLADDSALIRAGLRSVFEGLGSAMTMLDAASLEEAENALAAEPALGFAFMDLELPGLGGAAGLKHFAGRFPGLKIAATAAQPERGALVQAFEAGAVAYLPKSLPLAQLKNVMRLVLEGGSYAPPDMLIEQLRAQPRGLRPGGELTPFAALTVRQREVLHRLAQGLSNRDIAQHLGVSEATVKVHVNRILKALHVKNRSQAAITATRFLEREYF